MARKRSRLKDKNIFKQNNTFDDLIGSSPQTEENEDDMPQEETGNEATSSAQPAGNEVTGPPAEIDPPADTDTTDPLNALAAEAALAAGDSTAMESTSEDLPRNEAEFDLGAALSQEAALAATNPEDMFATDTLAGDEPDFPPALETRPAEDDLPDFPPAIEGTTFSAAPTAAEPTPEPDFPPALETRPAEDDLPDFPPALEEPMTAEPPTFEPTTPPSSDLDHSATDNSSSTWEDSFNFPPAGLGNGEAALADDTNLPAGEAGFDQPMDLPGGEAGFGNAVPAETADLPIGEAGFDQPATTPASEIPASETPMADTPAAEQPTFETPVATPAGSFTASTGASSDLYEPATPPTSRPVPPPPTSSSVTGTTPSAIAQPVGDTFAVSRTTRLTLDDDTINDLVDFTGVADEPQTIRFQLPEDIDELTPEERKRRMLLLKDEHYKEQFEKIYKAIDEQYEKLLDTNISANEPITNWAHNLLAETRYIIMNYHTEYFPRAEYNIQQVKARLDRAVESQRASNHWAWLIIIWGLLWFFTFLYLIFRPSLIINFLAIDPGVGSDFLDAPVLLRTIFFGGIGGVTSVFYSLLKYISTRRYDKQWNVSYFVKPLMGMVIGTLIYMLIFVVAGVLGFDIVPQGAPQTANSLAVLTYFVALAAGFKENVAFALLGRMMKFLFREQDEEEGPGRRPNAEPPSGPLSSS